MFKALEAVEKKVQNSKIAEGLSTKLSHPWIPILLKYSEELRSSPHHSTVGESKNIDTVQYQIVYGDPEY